MSDCIFCRISEGSISSNFVYQDEDVMVIRDIHPAAPVHLLVIPREHVSDIMAADETLITSLVALVKKIIREQKITNYRLVTNGGGAALIEHLHVHLMGEVDKHRDL